MGGIWERSVGSIKYHLKRTMKDRILSFEEYTTVLSQIEAILNSRPTSPLSENPEDLVVSTPGHFLIGEALTAPIEMDYINTKQNRLSNWELCGRLKQEFWAKWSNEYISSLQKRSKLAEERRNLKVGDMVLLKEENTAPLFLPLGRVERIHRGDDEKVRVAEIFTKGRICKRPIVKLALLPISENTNNTNSDLMSVWYKENVVTKTNNDLSFKSSTQETNEKLSTNSSIEKSKEIITPHKTKTSDHLDTKSKENSICKHKKYNEKTNEVRRSNRKNRHR